MTDSPVNPVYRVKQDPYAHKGKHPTGKPESEWDSHERMLYSPLPGYLEPFQCKCDGPEILRYSLLNDDERSWIQKMMKTGMTIDDRIARLEPLGHFCAKCKLAIGYTVFNAVRTCEGCGFIYLPKPEKGTYPIKFFLCERCDV